MNKFVLALFSLTILSSCSNDELMVGAEYCRTVGEIVNYQRQHCYIAENEGIKIIVDDMFENPIRFSMHGREYFMRPSGSKKYVK